VADVKQRLREELLVARDGRPPRITAYRGRGPLRKWVRVSAVRLTLRALSARRRSRERGDSALADRVAAGDTPSGAFLRRAHGGELLSLLREAIASLSDEQRALLRRQLLDGRTVDEIAAEDGVHPVTAARRLARARAQVLSFARAGAMKRLRIPRGEAESLLRGLRGEMDLSLSRLLARRRPS